MPKINIQDVNKYGGSGGGGEFFKLDDDGDTANIRFMISDEQDLNEYIYVVHDVEVPDSKYARPVNCLREYDAPVSDCPLCRAGYRTSTKLILPIYDIEDDSVKMWTRGKTFISKMTSLCARYKNLVSHTFDIERVGAKGDKKTSYEIYETGSDETELEDLPEIPEILGNFYVLDKTAEDMEYYVETEEFPPVDEDVDVPKRKHTSKRDDEEDERPRRRDRVQRTERRRTPASRGRKKDKF